MESTEESQYFLTIINESLECVARLSFIKLSQIKQFSNKDSLIKKIITACST